MRVTEASKRKQILDNIQKTTSRLQDVQMQMATGKKINKPSDDPIGSARMQDIVSTISTQKQTKQNINEHIGLLTRIENEIMHMADLLGKAKTLALSQAGSEANPESRLMVSREFAAIRKSIFDAANSREGKLYLFSGFKSLSPALKRNSIVQPAKVESGSIKQKDISDLINVDQYRAIFEGYSNNDYRLRITESGSWGEARCEISDDGGRTWGKEEILRPVMQMYNPAGKTDEKVVLKFSDELGLVGNDIPGYFDFTQEASQLVLDSLGLMFPEGMEYVYIPNPEISYNGSDEKKEVLISNGVSIPIQITARDLLISEGKHDLDTFSLLSSVERALIENDGTTLANRLKELDQALEQVLKRQADIGNTVRELESAKQKIETLQFDHERRLSNIRDNDLAQSVIDVKTAEANNRLSLDTGSRLIQPSLTEFLR